MSWQPTASIETLKLRAKLLAHIRAFFTQRQYLEVETPIMAHFGVTDVYLNSIQAQFRAQPYYLQTSPEYHMKRLLAAGSGPIFQLARVFRDDELGHWHNPEFTLLEWYQLDVDHHTLMEEVSLLLQQTLQTGPITKKAYQQAFIDIVQLDPLSASIEEFKHCLEAYELHNVLALDEQDRDQYLFLIMSHIIEPAFAAEKNPVALYDFPVSQAALAQVHDGVASRFEIYYKGVELANGFHELTDSLAQKQRFMQDQQKRVAQGLPEVPMDGFFLSALEQGLPACSGVALGIDRLLALALEEKSIAKVMSFTISNA